MGATSDRSVAAPCRKVEAAVKGGFDGEEHPEHDTTVVAVLQGLHPIGVDGIVKVLNGDLALVEPEVPRGMEARVNDLMAALRRADEEPETPPLAPT